MDKIRLLFSFDPIVIYACTQSHRRSNITTLTVFRPCACVPIYTCLYICATVCRNFVGRATENPCVCMCVWLINFHLCTCTTWITIVKTRVLWRQHKSQPNNNNKRFQMFQLFGFVFFFHFYPTISRFSENKKQMRLAPMHT